MVKNNSVSQKLQSAYQSYMKKYDKGLVIVPLPTAVGKTYNCCQSIADYVLKHGKEGKKIIFITSLTKNLPEDDLRKAFCVRNLDYDQSVLLFRGYTECIVKAFDEGVFCKIPKEFDEEGYTEICKTLKKLRNEKSVLRNACSKNKALVPYVENSIKMLESNLNAQEGLFRKGVSHYLRTHARIKKTTVESLVYSDPRFEWVQELYPSVMYKKRQVYLMTMKKFLMGGERIIDKENYFSAEWLKDKIVFIDEYDATKEDCIQYIVGDEDKRHATSVIKLFLTIKNGLEDEELFSRLPQEAADLVTGNKTSRCSLLKQSHNIVSKYNLDYSYKFVGHTSKAPLFMYYSTSWTSIVAPGKPTFPVIQFDKNEKRNSIKTVRELPPEKFSDITLFQLLTDIESFIRHFARFLSQWAKGYCDVKNAEIEQRNHGTEEDEQPINYIQAVDTLLYKFHLTEDEKNILLSGYNIYRKRRWSKYVRPNSFFRDGATWYSFEDSDNRRDDTLISMIKINDTPENMILYMAKSTLVFGMSATANCKTVIGNYCEDFLRQELNFTEDGELHNDFHDMLEEHPELANAIKHELSIKYSNYLDYGYNGKIRRISEQDGNKLISILGPNILCSKYDAALLSGGFLQKSLWLEWNIEDGKTYTQQVENIVEREVERYLMDNDDADCRDYLLSKYYNITKVMHEFAYSISNQSCLVVNMNMPTVNGKLNVNTLEQIVDLTNWYFKRTYDEYNPLELFVIRSADFQEHRGEFDQKLADGKRLFIVSTYQTIGAGVNLQHPICNWIRPYLSLLPTDDGRDKGKKDIDVLAMLDVTHSVTNFRDRPFTHSMQMRNIIETESCAEVNKITLSQRNNQIKSGFRAMSNISNGSWNCINHTDQVSKQITHWIVQTDGRTKRSPWRNRLQNFYIYDNVLNALDVDYLTKMAPYISPELYACLTSIKNIKNTSEKEPETLLAARRVTLATRRQIARMIGSIHLYGNKPGINWTEYDMESWNHWRELVLKAPTVNDQLLHSDRFYEDFYITTDSKKDLSAYKYYNHGDFKEVYIGLDKPSEIKQQMQQMFGDNFDPLALRTVSEDDARIKQILAFPGMRENFERHGYATKFTPAPYIINPIMYSNIYKGALGEIAGRFILESMGVKLSDIEDPNKFEAFDFYLTDFPDVYIDFKHHRMPHIDDNARIEYNEAQRDKIQLKMEIIGAKRVFIVGLLEPDEACITARTESDITYIPYLINKDGSPAQDNINFLISTLYE